MTVEVHVEQVNVVVEPIVDAPNVEVQPVNIEVVLDPVNVDVVLSPVDIHVNPAGTPGPPGPPGTTDKIVFTRVAGEDLAAYRVVVPTAAGVMHADPTDTDHLTMPIRLALADALTGEPLQVVAFGNVVNPAWSWTPGVPLYVGLDGVLQEATPTGVSWVRIAGWVIRPTEIVFEPRDPIGVV